MSLRLGLTRLTGDSISKLVDGAETILEPMSTAYGNNLVEDPDHPLQRELKKIRKAIEISGGEKQRMVA